MRILRRPILCLRSARGSLEEDVSTLTHSTGNQLDRLIYEINRSMILAQRIEHSFQFSTHWDNIKWKKKIDLTPAQQKLLEEARKDIKGTDHRNLDEFGKDVDGGQIILNPIVSWAIKSDPRYEGTNKKDKNLEKTLLNLTEPNSEKVYLDIVDLHLLNSLKKENFFGKEKNLFWDLPPDFL